MTEPQQYKSSQGEYIVHVCLACGSGVVSKPLHDKWHERLDGIVPLKEVDG